MNKKQKKVLIRILLAAACMAVFSLLLFILFTLVPIVMAVVPIEPLQALIDGSQLAPLFDSRLILAILNGGI